MVARISSEGELTRYRARPVDTILSSPQFIIANFENLFPALGLIAREKVEVTSSPYRCEVPRLWHIRKMLLAGEIGVGQLHLKARPVEIEKLPLFCLV